MAKLGEICLINPKSCTLRDDTEVSFIPMTKVGEHGEFDASEIKNYSEVKKGFTNFQNGDVLFAKITPCMENGKGAIAHNMKNGIGFGSTEFHVLRPDTDKITREWLYYLTTWKTFRKEAERNMTGSAGQKRVPKTFLENYVVNLPDIDTQKSENKILRKVDDLISLCKQQLAKLDELVKARFVEMFGDPIRNDKHFVQKTGKSLFCFSSGKFLQEEKRFQHGFPVYGGNGITWYTDIPLVKKPTIIIGRVGAYCGNVRMVNVPVWITDNAIYIKEFKTRELNLHFLLMLMKYMKFSNYADYSGQPKITQKPLETLIYIVPPLELQNRFAAFVERVDQEKQTVQQSLEKLELMKKALMQEYFG